MSRVLVEPNARPRDRRALALEMLRSLPLWLGLWLFSRWVILEDWVARWQTIANDVRYYFGSLSDPGLGDQRLIEYPLPVVWFLDALRVVGTDHDSYLVVFAFSMALLDLALMVLLWRTGRIEAVAFWIIFIHCYGSLIWFRYDMVPALAVGLAALWVTRHPRWSGAMVAIGAALKLWPALLIAALVGRHRPGRARMAAFGVVGFIAAMLAFAGGGFDRLLSPLTWQDERGLQIESIPATWPMWQHAFSPRYEWKVEFSAFKAFEIFGPGVDGWVSLASVLMVVVVAGAIAMGVVIWRRGALPADVLTLCLVSIVAGMLVANKTFSPQYLVWLGAPLAALLVESHRRLRWPAISLAVIGVVLAYLTQQIYPVRYAGLISPTHNDQGDTVVLAARNLLLVLFWLLSSAWAWRLLLSPQHSTTAAQTPSWPSPVDTPLADFRSATP